MSEEKIDSGTVILNEKNVEIGVIKKIYSSRLARLELPNSTSIAFDPSLVKNISSSGRLIKKKTAFITEDAEKFFKGATDILDSILEKSIGILIKHLSVLDEKKALQQFEFDILNKVEIPDNIKIQEAIGFVRGIELIGKTSQDYLIKTIFQITEAKPELKTNIQPEIVVDRLNQEKAFNRILWNILRIGINLATKLKDISLIEANFDAIEEIGLKHIEIELKASSSNDILYWQTRIEECISRYIALMLLSLDPEKQNNQKNYFKIKFDENLKEIKISNNLKELAQKTFETFDLKEFENLKTIELKHSGIKGFDLKLMSEKNAMKQLLIKVNDFLEKEGKNANLVNLSKLLDQFAREVRDVSKEFLNILFEIGQYLKKIEYGDSKAQDFYANIMNKIHQRKYDELVEIMEKINGLVKTKSI